MRFSTVFILALSLAAAWALPKYSNRIVGGSVTTINNYRYTVGLMYSHNLVSYSLSCGGTILTTTAIVSAAHCFVGDSANNWRVRVGSSFASSGGVVHTVSRIVIHPSYTNRNLDPDVAILRLSSAIAYNANAGPVRIAGTNYNLADNTAVTALGWGHTNENGAISEQLRHVIIWIVNQQVCAQRYLELANSMWWRHVPAITNGMLCAGWLDVGGRDACQGDSGGPLIHSGDVLVGITSWGEGCARAQYPGVSSRVSAYNAWIQANAN